MRKRQGAYLPHWTEENAVYSITFRLADSLPAKVIQRILFERRDLVARAAQAGRPLTDDELRRLDELTSRKIEEFLDQGVGACWLAQEAVAAEVAASLNHFNERRYRLHAWCIMPNHVHLIIQPLAGCGLENILHSLKSYTAQKVNRLLNRKGVFWQAEYYDHLLRDRSEWLRAMEYVISNPQKANLPNWKWFWPSP